MDQPAALEVAGGGGRDCSQRCCSMWSYRCHRTLSTISEQQSNTDVELLGLSVIGE